MRVINNAKTPDFASLLQPGLHHHSPTAVLNDSNLDPHEKRAILSSWASDLYAVESCPWLRNVPGLKTPLRLSDILAALQALDADDDPPPGGVPMRIAGSRQTREPAWRSARD